MDGKAAGRPVVWAKLHDQERDIPEMYLKDREAGGAVTTPARPRRPRDP